MLLFNQPNSKWDIFISWSGDEYGLRLAKALKTFFEGFAIKAFVSGVDVAPGVRWNQEIREAIQSSRAGIILLTKATRYEVWPHFEAGALSIDDKKRVTPLLFDDMTNNLVTSPLRAQNIKKFGEEALRALVRDNLTTLKDQPKMVDRLFPQLWEQLENEVEAAGPHRDKDVPDVKPLSEFPVFPPTLKFLCDRWLVRRADVTRGGGSDFKLHTFSGFLDDDRPDHQPVHEVKATDDHEAVYHLWANSEDCSSISAHINRTPKVRHVIRFCNGGHEHLTNVAFRPSGRRLLRTRDGQQQFRRLEFSVRIPPKREAVDLNDVTRTEDDAEEIVLGVRLMDRYRTHWQLCVKGNQKYAWYSVRRPTAEEWMTVRIDLLSPPASQEWKVFEQDGNPWYGEDKPDFSVIMAVVIECGTGFKGVAVPGQGVFEIADFVIDTNPPGTSVGEKA